MLFIINIIGLKYLGASVKGDNFCWTLYAVCLNVGDEEVATERNEERTRPGVTTADRRKASERKAAVEMIQKHK